MEAKLTPPLPTEVTSYNWDGLQEQGFKWITNLEWPLCSSQQYVEGLRKRLGEKNVKLGLKANLDGQPDPDFCPKSSMVGVYIKRA